MEYSDIFKKVKRASRTILPLGDECRSAILKDLADRLIENSELILSANSVDLSRMDPANPLYDRLKLTPQRLEDIASDMRHVATLECPLGEILEDRILPNGLRLRRVRVPFGVIGIIYEARPNVTFDVFSLCFKSGNACVLKGGRDAEESNKAIVKIIHDTLDSHGVDRDIIELLPATHEATGAMLGAVGYIDVCIPRGGRRLIDFVRQNAKVPVIETGAGVVHCYVDGSADMDMASRIVENAKTRRVSVCNALDTLLVDRMAINYLCRIVDPLSEKGVELHADEEAMSVLMDCYPENLLVAADCSTFDTEWMDYKMGVRIVDGIEEALDHITAHGSGHSESIVTNDRDNASLFRDSVDAACVYVNAPTSFTDGAQFGLGAEIGISTQKLGPRGPMGLREITTYKWIIDGEGQTRE